MHDLLTHRLLPVLSGLLLLAVACDDAQQDPEQEIGGEAIADMDDTRLDMMVARDMGQLPFDQGIDMMTTTDDQGMTAADQSTPPPDDQGGMTPADQGVDQGSSDQGVDQGVDPCVYPQDAFHVSASQGSDAAAGSASSPFKTIARAMRAVTAGSTVIVHEGTYAEGVTFTTSGTAGAPITLRAACGVRPVLDGASVRSPNDGLPALIKIVDQRYIRVQGFELRGLQAAQRDEFPSAIWVRGSSHHIELIDHKIHEVSAHNGGNQSGAHGLAIYGTSRSPVHDVLIEGNELYDLTLGWSEALVINGNVRDFIVRGNDVHDVDNIAYDFIGFESSVCDECVQDDVVGVDNVNRARRGLITQNSASNVSSFGNPAYGNTKAAGCFYVDGGAQLIIERNLAARCDIGVELASEAFGKSTREIILRHNVLFDHDVTAIATGGYDPGNGAGGGSARECAIVHNTIINSSVDGWADTSILLQNRNINNLYQNNIVMGTAGMAAIADEGEKNTGNTFSHNLYQGDLNNLSAGTGSLNAAAKFVDAGARDYRLMANSPGVNAGTMLPLDIVGAVDFSGSPRVNGVVDIGAFEQ